MRPAATFVTLLILFSGDGRSTPKPLAAQGSPAVDATLLSPLRWRSIGPANTGGRIDDFAVARVPGQPDAIYVATASGGVFKSTNQGTSWTPVFDRVDAMMSIGDIAVAPSNPNVVWVGTGEANNRQSSSWGDGVYKSIDGGRTWKASGLADTRHIGRIVVHPVEPRHRLRRGGRPSLGTERRARRLQDHRRRPDVDEGAVRRRQHRRHRPRDRSRRIPTRCSRRRTSASARRGASTAAVPAAASTARATAARPGRS